MKNTIWRLKIISILAVFGIFLLSGSSTTDSTVVFRNQADSFVFLPDGDNLFPNFQDLMPGDTATQNIIIRNDSEDAVQLLFSAEVASAKDMEFLSYINMKITYVDVSGADQILYDGLAKDIASSSKLLGSPVDLGAYKTGDEGSLEVTLAIQDAMPNIFHNYVAQLTWVFTAEGMVEPTPTPTVTPTPKANPTPKPIRPFFLKTGETDSWNNGVAIGVLILAGSIALTGFIIWKRRQHHSGDEKK